MKIAKGGRTIYGFDVGVIMLDTSFPRIPGDIGNANTFDFPVMYDKAVGWKPQKVVLDLQKQDIQPFIESARRLEQNGCRIITTSCGFLSLFQKELADSVNVTVYTSALLLAPMIRRTISSEKKVCILTANKEKLTDEHLHSVGINRDDYVIYGMEEEATFTPFTVEDWLEVDVDACQCELEKVVNEAMNNNNIGAILLECTNMPPFTKYIQKISGVPVYDVVSLVKMGYESLNDEGY